MSYIQIHDALTTKKIFLKRLKEPCPNAVSFIKTGTKLVLTCKIQRNANLRTGPLFFKLKMRIITQIILVHGCSTDDQRNTTACSAV